MTFFARLKAENAKLAVFDEASCAIYIPWREYQFRWDWFIALSAIFVGVFFLAGLSEIQRLSHFVIAAVIFVGLFAALAYFWFRQFNNEAITFPVYINADGICGTGEFLNSATRWHEIDELCLTHPSRGLAFSPLCLGLSLMADGREISYIALPYITPDEYKKLDRILAKLAAMHEVHYRTSTAA
ncbi:hypothetical protein [Maritalea myrionectae]|uniref:hypothetical protein n=1 Tax=Maritalea myrionectae TaxID=454601 RepID=UPI000403A9A0|nr:hypothetical protein [Maritalea myrionectae]